MQYQPHLPGDEQFNRMLVVPELFAAKPESLTEQLFIERSLTEKISNLYSKLTGFIIILSNKKERHIKCQTM